MITLIRHVRMIVDNARLTSEQYALIKSQKELIEVLRETHATQMQAASLDHIREMQGTIAGWLISIEKPEVDMRETLAAMFAVLDHQVAALEEHIL